MKIKILIVILLVSFGLAAEEMRALWIPSWDLVNRDTIEDIIKKAAKADINTLLVEVRYRSDTFYIPNRYSTAFPNPDSSSRLLQEKFDALQYVIDRAFVYDLKVYAWVTMYVATAGDMEKNNNNNPWFRAPELLTTDVNWRKMPHNELEGAFLDPGIPAVQNYLYNVVLDIATNYRIDGIQLDYIRYPGTGWGYHPLAVELYQQDVHNPSRERWHKWRCDQVTELVKRIRKGLRNHAPDVELTAAVIADPDHAYKEYNQDWLLWLRKGYVQRVFPMNYSANDDDFKNVLNKIALHGYKNQTVMGIRAWNNSNGYKAEDINKKIDITWKRGIWNYALFSSTGLNENDYWKNLLIRKSR
ncbi:MAG: family 10 glycosylhydrolase [Candidatus Cloacimonetes bacterium]|nr:family 10 glycosylhydrolase [Candidatus Cloacimonadota bacterium]